MAGVLESKKWEVLPQDGRAAQSLCEQLGVSPLVARVLIARGVSSTAEARAFLEPSLTRDWADPLEIPGMAEAADRVERAVTSNERIAVFGDFDVDGMTSTCLLTQSLRSFGAVCDPYIPHRFGEGYGLSQEALGRVIEGSHPDLVITVDNGIAAKHEVAWLLDQGIDVVITDHHEPGDLVPEHVPVTDPKISETCSSRELAGAGVALKLVCELGRRLGQPDLWLNHLDLAALGTVSDMMLLQGENRSLVAAGITQMRQSARPGLIALAATAGTDLSQICADGLPFSIIPRLNAAGRMGCTEVAFDLLFTDDPAEAAVLAGMLERTNTERRETELELSEAAFDTLENTYRGERVIVCGGQDWHEGVKGIVASRVVNRYHVPAIIFSISDGIARGSGRSVGSVDLFHAVEQCSDLLVRFGGHAGAVGVTCEESKIDAFRERLCEVMAELPEDQFMDRGEVCTLANLSELNQATIAELEVLQPFGQGNKRPYFGVSGVFMRNRARVGYDGNHLRFVATDGAASVSAIMFRTPGIERAYACEGLVDLVVDAVNETWQGRTQPKLMVRDILYRDEAAPGPRLTDELFGAKEESDLLPAGTAENSTPSPERAELSRLSNAGLTQRLKQLFIGSADLLPAQREALDRLDAGSSTLCVMATGRGKSLIFHLHAARCALRGGQASVFVYPLRALVSDQSFHLSESFERFGLVVRVLTGETSAQERSEVYDALAAGKVDVILTTPEYLALHVADFARSGRVGFLAIDEAHHAGTARGGNRSAYTELPRIRQVLGDPTCLALTATASTPVAHEICRLLGIAEQNVIVDRTLRDNLRIDDRRDLRDRDMFLASVVAAGQKTIVYVNSRSQASSLTRTLRDKVGDMGHRIAFYHAGLPRDLRHRVEEAFRDGRLSCIVSTSAFGEGVNLPGVRNVVLYHMPFGTTEFNQMSGRAGRDGKPATIYLLYGSRDARINEKLLLTSAPKRDDLAVLYRALMTQSARDGGVVRVSDAALLEVVTSISDKVALDERSVASGIAVFEELGFLRVEGFDDHRAIYMVTSPPKVELETSLRYSEGKSSIAEFAAFREWALSSLPQEMLAHINRPIAPTFGRTVDR